MIILILIHKDDRDPLGKSLLMQLFYSVDAGSKTNEMALKTIRKPQLAQPTCSPHLDFLVPTTEAIRINQT